MYDPIRKLNKVNLVLQQSLAAAHRVRDLIGEPNEIVERPDALAVTGVEHSIEFGSVSFGYTGQGVLHEVDLTIAAGEVVALVGPSGAGKTTLVKYLLQRKSGLEFSISYTTRDKRNTEVDGRDYYFVDEASFLKLKEDGELLESALVFGNHYGTGRRQVEQQLENGKHVILEIDWQGARQVRASMPDCVSIFILPPSPKELERRLRYRRTDSDWVIARRLDAARDDMTHWDEFDYVIINDDLQQAVRELEAIVEGGGAANSTADPALRQKLEQLLESG